MLNDLVRRPRLVMGGFGVICLAAVVGAALLGWAFNLEVCAMCWFQRLAFVLAGGGFLLSAIWPSVRLFTLRLSELGLLLGLESAARQTYLIAHPEAAGGNCGAGLFYYLQIQDYKGFLEAGMLGGIDCAENQPLILGLHLPQWSLIGFTATILVYLAWCFLQAKAKTGGS